MRSSLVFLGVCLLVVAGTAMDGGLEREGDSRRYPLRSPLGSGGDDLALEKVDGPPVSEDLNVLGRGGDGGGDEEPVDPLAEEASYQRQKLEVMKQRRTYEVQSDTPLELRGSRLSQCKPFDLGFFGTLANSRAEQKRAQTAACAFCMAMQIVPAEKRKCNSLFTTPPSGVYSKLCSDMQKRRVGDDFVGDDFVPSPDDDKEAVAFKEALAFKACAEMQCCNYETKDDLIDDGECDKYAHMNPNSEVSSTCENCVHDIAMSVSKTEEPISIMKSGRGTLTKNVMARLLARSQCQQKGCCHPATSRVPLVDIKYRDRVNPAKSSPGSSALVAGPQYKAAKGSINWSKNMNACIDCRRLSLHKLQHYYKRSFPTPFDSPEDEMKMDSYTGEMIRGCDASDKTCKTIEGRMDHFLRLHGNPLDMLLMGPDWMCAALSNDVCSIENPAYRNNERMHDVIVNGILDSPYSELVAEGKPVPGVYDPNSFCVPLDDVTRRKAREVQEGLMKQYDMTVGMCRDTIGLGNQGQTLDDIERTRKEGLCKAESSCLAEGKPPAMCKQEANLSYHSWRVRDFQGSPALRQAWSNEMACQMRKFIRDPTNAEDEMLTLGTLFNMGIWGPLEATLHSFKKLVESGVPDFTPSSAASPANFFYTHEEYNLRANQCSYPYYLDRLSHLYIMYQWIARKSEEERNGGKPWAEVLGDVENVCCDENNRLAVFDASNDEFCKDYMKKRAARKAMEKEKKEREKAAESSSSGTEDESVGLVDDDVRSSEDGSNTGSSVMEVPPPLGDDSEDPVGPAVEDPVGAGGRASKEERDLDAK